MPNRPQFSRRAILVIITVLSVPLAMFARGLFIVGYFALCVAAGGSIGYLLPDRAMESIR